jgi:hypothetical protein
VLVIGFHDAIANPVAEVARLLRRAVAVVEPIRHIGLVLINDEGGLDLLLTALDPGGELGVRDRAGGQLGDEFR